MPRLVLGGVDARDADGLAERVGALLADWDIVATRTVDATVGALTGAPFEALVVAAQSPPFDDPIPLRLARDVRPDAVRIAVVADRHVEVDLRLAGLAHRCIVGPCRPRDVVTAVRRGRETLDRLDHPVVRASVGGTGALLSPPDLVADLSRTVAEPAATTAQVAAVVARDPAVSARILQLANSVLFAGSATATTIEEGVRRLGFDAIRSLTVVAEAVRVLGPHADRAAVEAEARHGVEVGRAAAEILAGQAEAADAFTAGVLHDVGKLVLIDRDPGGWAARQGTAARSGRPLFAVEQDDLGVTHADVGAALLQLWGLPGPIVDAVALHHRPAAAGADLGLAGAVHIADAICHQGPDVGTDADPLLDRDYVDGAGRSVDLPRWARTLGRAPG